MTDNPFMKTIQQLNLKLGLSGCQIIVLERVQSTPEPDYCIHGKVTCHKCGAWCWLGDQSHALVLKGKTAPLCIECVTTMRVGVPGQLVENVNDRRRSEGPH